MILLVFIFVSNSNYLGVTEYDRSRNWLRAGTYYYGRKDFNRALQNFGQALQLNPDSTEAYVGAGNVALSKNKIPEALEFHRIAEQVEPGNAQVKYNLGVCCQLLGDRDGAERNFLSPLRIVPDYEKAKEQLEWIKDQRTR